MAHVKVVVDCESLSAPLTGIGWYTLNLVTALSQASEMASLKCFDGHVLNSLELSTRPVLSGGSGQMSLGPLRVVKQLLREQPFAYQLRRHFREKRFRSAVQGLDDHVYHQPAFILSPFPGRKVTTVHDLSFIRYPEAHPAGRVAYLSRHLPVSLERADRIIVPSEFTRRELLSLFALDARKIAVTPLGVCDGFRMRHEEECQAVLTARRLAYRGYVLFVGTLEPRKNLGLLIDAWLSLPVQVRERHPLVIVGGRGWGDDRLLQRIKRLERHMPLRYLDYVPADSLSILYSSAAMLVYPSSYEGFGLPVLEAMASGTPVVCASGTPMADFAAEAAFLYPGGDADALRAVVFSVLNDREGVSGRVRIGLEIASRYTWSACAAMTLRVYQSLC